MKKKNMILGSLGLVAMGLAIVGASAYAYQGDPTKQGPNYTPERHEVMTRAFENKDYNAWKEQMGDRGAARRITEENFARFVEMRQLMLDGKITEANAIRAELGLGQRNGRGIGKSDGQRGQNRGGNFIDANGDGKCDRL